MNTISEVASATLPSTIKAVDDEVERLRGGIINLYRRRNSLLPVGRMPPEVLGNMFMFCLLACPMSHFSFGIIDSKSPDCWINVTHVCHYWRETSLSTPLLWSHLTPMPRKWMESFISRSKAVAIRWRMSYASQAALDILFSNPDAVKRVQELHIRGDHDTVQEILSSFSTCEGDPTRPLLVTSLRLHKMPWESSYSKIPPEFSSRRFPLLRELELLCCEVDWSSPLFTSSNLTHLAISGKLLDPLPFPQLMVILKTQYALKHLTLDLDGVSTFDGSFNIHLPSIQTIRLIGTSSTCLDFWRQISHPRAPLSSSFLLRYPSAPWMPNEEGKTELEDSILPFLAEFFNSGNPNGEHHPVVEGLNLESHRNSYALSCSSANSAAKSGLTLGITLNWDRTSVSACQTLTQRVLETLPLGSLKRLNLDSIHLTLENWLALFATASRVTEIKVIGAEVSLNLLKALTTDQVMDSGSAAGQCSRPTFSIPLVGLHRLEFENLDFGRDRHTMEAIQRCLSKRLEEGSKLELLVLRNCRKLDSGRVASLMSDEAVTKIDWDQFEDMEDYYIGCSPPSPYMNGTGSSPPNDFYELLDMQ